MAPSRRSPGAFSVAILAATAAVFSPSVLAAPHLSETEGGLDARQLPNNPITAYMPQRGTCPSGDMVRPASGINKEEAAFVAGRKKAAGAALKKWLAKHGDFPALKEYPTMGLADGGGGFRSAVVSTGFHKAWSDEEKVKYPTSGLYQAMTYEAGLSGTSLLLGAFSSNNWPTAQYVEDELFVPAFAKGLLPGPEDSQKLATIAKDVASKQGAGYVVSSTDPWGRLLGYMGLTGTDGGVEKKLTDVPEQSKYKAHQVPMPIYTTLGVEDPQTGCGLPFRNATQYEFTPYEFGSWSKGVNGFTPTKYLGTTLKDGKPLAPLCTTNYDNMAFVMGTSTQIFNQYICGRYKHKLLPNNFFGGPALLKFMKEFTKPLFGLTAEAFFTQLPNPFMGRSSSSYVTDKPFLNLIDGGESIQVPPIWPFLYRPVDVLVVLDNSADTPQELPNGAQIHNTYIQAGINGIKGRLPKIPTSPELEKRNPKHAPIAFGCNSKGNELTIMYIQNKVYSYNTGINAGKAQFSEEMTRKSIDNGVKIATAGGEKDFSTCMGCIFIKRKAAKEGKKLPSSCDACFKKYCYN